MHDRRANGEFLCRTLTKLSSVPSKVAVFVIVWAGNAARHRGLSALASVSHWQRRPCRHLPNTHTDAIQICQPDTTDWKL